MPRNWPRSLSLSRATNTYMQAYHLTLIHMPNRMHARRKIYDMGLKPFALSPHLPHSKLQLATHYKESNKV